ncbi:XRE family transcriptional regulator [Halobacillus karajensis]|uniref:XRE family transcriptional regulator n=1 Tax=Halobacillus karajensis TaxID=195088 RepID=UPI0012DE835B|nr:XRE family transcriptional regulator [Halobacillus karajensis]
MSKKVKSNLGEIIESKGIMKSWIAKQTGATKSQVTRWCNNKDGAAESTPSVYYILQLEKLLDTPVRKMFEIIEEE